MAPEDFLPTSLHSQLLRSSFRYGEASLDNPRGGFLLQKALETGRLYFVDAETDYHLVVPGDAIAPEPIWNSKPDGSATPSFAPPLIDFLGLINSTPPFALIPHPIEDKIVLHELKTDVHSLDFVNAWLAGPTLPPDQIGGVSARLKKTSSSLPAPVAPKTETLKKSTPSIHLHLHRANPFSHGGHHLSGKPEPVIATLAFRYHGHEFIPDLSTKPSGKASFTITKKDTYCTIWRDTAAERETTLHLVREHDFVPAGALDNQISSNHC